MHDSKIADTNFDDSTFNRLAIWLAVLGLLLIYALIATNAAPKTLVFIVVASLMLAILCYGFPHPTSITVHQLLHNFDTNTFLLLISVMVLAAQLDIAGIFDWAAVYLFSRSEDRVWPLLHRLGVCTFCLAVGLDNCTSIALMLPVAMRCCQFARLRARPVGLMVLMISNVASMATMIGNSPNQLIWFDGHTSLMDDISIVKFMAHMLFFVVIVMAGLYVQLRFVQLRNLRLPKVIQLEQGLVGQQEVFDASLTGRNQPEETFEEKVSRYRRTVSAILLRFCGLIYGHRF